MNRIEVPVGMFQILTAQSTIKTVAVGDPLIADVQVLSSRALLINGRKPGITSVVIWDAKDIRQHEVVVTGYAPSLVDEIRQAVANPEVRVRIVRDSVVLEGEVKDDSEVARAEKIAMLFAPNVVNLLKVRPGAAAVIPAVEVENVRKAVAPFKVQVDTIGDRVFLRGSVDTEAIRTQAESAAKAFTDKVVNQIVVLPYTPEELQTTIGLPNVTVRLVRDQIVLDGMVEKKEQAEQAAIVATRGGKTVVNNIRYPEPQPPPKLLDEIQEAINEGMGMMSGAGIRVRGTEQRVILEGETDDLGQADRAYKIAITFLGQAGQVDTSLLIVNHANLVNIQMHIVEVNRNRAKKLGFEYPPFNSTDTPFIFGEVAGANSPLRRISPITVGVFALAESNAARILSQPNATVLSGRITRFQVGGEVPIPMSTNTGTGLQQQSVTFRPFGLIFLIQPTLTPNGDITVDMRTQVSAPDDTRAAIIGGTRVPGFTTREANTYVTIPNGGTMGIGGLIDRRDLTIVRRIPLVSGLPVIGKLFTSKEFQRDESELVIFLKVQSTGSPIRQPYAPPAPVPPPGLLPAPTESLSTSGSSGSGS